MAAIGTRLEIDLGERRIDLLLQAPNLQQLPVHRVAKATGDAVVVTATPALNVERERMLLLARVVEREASYLEDTRPPPVRAADDARAGLEPAH